MSKFVSLTNYNFRYMTGQLLDKLGIAGIKIVYESGLVVKVNKINYLKSAIDWRLRHEAR